MYTGKRTFMYRVFLITLFFLSVGLQLSSAQEEKEDLGTETVTVTKAYTPTVSDAFKIKSTPNLNDSIVLQKKPITYSIFSVPVASTFSPQKGVAKSVERKPPPLLFNSYASFGVGNYANILGDFYTSRALDRASNLDVAFNHFSSLSGVNGTSLKSSFANTKAEVSFTKKKRDVDWGSEMGFQHQSYNWYGLPTETFTQTDILNINEVQNYFMGQVKGYVNLENSFLQKMDITYRRFWDSAESGENRAIINSAIEVPLNDEVLGVQLHMDYVGGNFKNASVSNSVNEAGIQYSNFQVGVNPALQMRNEDLSLDLGVQLVYGLDSENKENNFYMYPAVSGSYRLLEDTLIAYGGVTGELIQNSYFDFVDENPFVSPTLTLAPTDSKYNAYVGVKGQFIPNLSYNVKGFYAAENRKPLYRLNPINRFRTDDKGYTYGNSFDVFYDDVKTFGVFAELSLDIKSCFIMGLNAEVNDYSTETGNPAWNLPSIQMSLFIDYQIKEKWFTGVNLFYVGERDDFSSVVVQNVPVSEFPAELISLNAFFDVNAHVGYRYNKQLSFFIKGANLFNNDYQRWANFQVQGMQLLGGATYKFDF